MNKKFCTKCNLYLDISKFKKLTSKSALEKYRDGYYWCCNDCYRKIEWVYKPGTEPNNRKARRKDKLARRLTQVQSTYGISETDYLEKIEKQHNLCAICKHKDLNKVLCVDHNHSTGKVRGLLCRNCNVGLGNFKDNLNILQSAIAYLHEYEDKKEADYKTSEKEESGINHLSNSLG